MQDNIATDPELGMETTAGTYALVGSRVKTVSPATKQVPFLQNVMLCDLVNQKTVT